MHKNSFFIPAVLAFSLLVSSCAPVGVAAGVGAAAGIAAAQEGGISQAAVDARIQVEINDLWFRHNVDMFSKLDLTITQGRVLITGVVQNPEHRVEAVRLAWQPKGVKQVINEIRVANSEGITGFAKDTWISTRLRTALIFDKNIQSINYTIDTVQGTVYLMGFAQNRLELNRVVEKARTISGVKNVVSYVKLIGTQEDAASANSPGAGVSGADSAGAVSSGAAASQQGYQQETYPSQDPYPSNDTYPQGGGYDSGGYAPSPAGQQRQGIESEVLN